MAPVDFHDVMNGSFEIPVCNSTSDYHCYEEEDDEWVLDFIFVTSIVAPIVFGITFVVGTVGNGLLILTVLRNAAMRTKPNILIVSLAWGDFLLILISVPFVSTVFTLDAWWAGEAMCKLSETLQTLSLGVSVFTLTALSVDRFVAIVFPLASYSNSSRLYALVATGAIWIVSFLLSIMDLIGSHVHPVHGVPYDVCHLYPEGWGDEYVKFRVVFRFIVFFGLPMIVISTLYGIIACVLLVQVYKDGKGNRLLTKSTATTTGLGERGRMSASGLAKQMESRKKVAKVVLSFVAIFVVCWLPRHVYVICWNFSPLEYDSYWHAFKIVGFCLTFVYSSINPIILYAMNDDFRAYFKHYLCGCCCPSKRIAYARRRSRGMSLSGTGAFAGGGGGGGGNGGGLNHTMVTPNISMEDLVGGKS